jgi:uncharacterized membrane protein YhaH (DUF805 family)
MSGLMYFVWFLYWLLGVFVAIKFIEKVADSTSPAQKVVDGERDVNILEAIFIGSLAWVWPVFIVGYFLSYFIEGALIIYRRFKDD